jgi:hypothetical protein
MSVATGAKNRSSEIQVEICRNAFSRYHAHGKRDAQRSSPVRAINGLNYV